MTRSSLLRRVLLAIGVLTAALPGIRAEDPLPAKDTAGIAARLEPFVKAGTLAGAVTLVATRDRALSVETAGYADVAARKSMRPDALFWIASMTKPMTAAAVMMLVDEGKVALDDPVEKYLPELKGLWVVAEQDGDRLVLKRPAKPVTIRRLLSHTSGMPFASRLEQPTLDRFTLRDGVVSYAMTPLVYEPGSKYQYSNAGINTAGRIIEVVSRMPYEEFMHKRLFDPLGMKDTTFWPNEGQLARLAKAYRPGPPGKGLMETPIGQLRYPLTDRTRQPMPAGGLFSTADDVGRFCRMVLGNGTFEGKQLLSARAVREMTSCQTADLPASYGLGWQTGRKAGERFGHGGAYSTQMTVDPRTGLVLVLLVHHAGFAGKEGGKIHATFLQTATERFGK